MLLPCAMGAVALIWAVLMPRHFRCKTPEKKPLSLLFKGLATVVCALFAAAACALGGDSASWLLFIGLCVCAAADVLLEVRFEVGGVAFFLGHVLYTFGFSLLRTPSWAAGVLFVAAFAGLSFFLTRYRGHLDRRMYLCLSAYSVALSALLSAAIAAAAFAWSARTALAALGAALFVVSDATLCRNVLEKREEKAHYISLGVYYMGQLCIALAAFTA